MVTEEIVLSLSIGPTTNSLNSFYFCMSMFQVSKEYFSECTPLQPGFSFFHTSSTYEVTIGGIEGTIKSVYFLDTYLRAGNAIPSLLNSPLSYPVSSCQIGENAMQMNTEIPQWIQENKWGNGFKEDREIWDNGNFNTGGGCDSNWKIEAEYVCMQNIIGLSIWEISCGNGKRESGETWDDGNNTDNKGWNNNWSGEITGWNCNGGTATSPDIWSTTWGDSIIAGNEVCDDGNNTDSIGCKDDCSGIISGYEWNATAAGSICTPKCGDEHKTVEEECEDWNNLSDDGWDTNCRIENGWTCIDQIIELKTKR